MTCHRIGRPPMGIIGLGTSSATSRIRVPLPPHKITTCMVFALFPRDPIRGRYEVIRTVGRSFPSVRSAGDLAEAGQCVKRDRDRAARTPRTSLLTEP